MRKITLFSLILASASALADVGWIDQDGKPVPESESQKAVAGFGGALIVTPDKNWEEKWNTSSDVTPQFTTTETVERGGELSILAIFTNPKLDESGAANVTLDIDVRRPDGSSSTHAEDAPCYQGEVHGPPQNVFLCSTVAGFVGEPADPAGTWSIRITLTDKNRKVSIPLSTKFVLVNDKEEPRPINGGD